MASKGEAPASLPSLKQIQDNSPYGAMTTSMRVAWEIARDSGLLDASSYLTALHNQLRLIEKEIVLARASRNDLNILAQMQAEYAHHSFPVRQSSDAAPNTHVTARP